MRPVPKYRMLFHIQCIVLFKYAYKDGQQAKISIRKKNKERKDERTNNRKKERKNH